MSKAENLQEEAVMEKVRLLIAGVGGYGSIYLDIWEKLNDPSIVVEGICEPKPGMEKLFPVIAERNIPVYSSLEEFYSKHEADLAILSTPIHLHHSQSVYCMEHGSNVLVEKPICTSTREVEELLQAEKRTGRFLAVGYQINYDLDMRRMKQDILSGRFGKPLSMKTIHCFRRGYRYYHRNNWAGHVMLDGYPVNDGPVNNSNAHQFQLMLFLLGSAMDRAAEVVNVEADLYRTDPTVENYDMAALRLMTDCGVPVYFYTGHRGREAEIGPVIEFAFEKAVITMEPAPEYGGERRYVARWKDGSREVYGGLLYDKTLYKYGQKMRDAIACTREGGHPICTIQAASSQLAVVEALAELPIKNIPEDQLERWESGGDQLIYLRDIEKIYQECFDKGLLPSEMQVPW